MTRNRTRNKNTTSAKQNETVTSVAKAEVFPTNKNKINTAKNKTDFFNILPIIKSPF